MKFSLKTSDTRRQHRSASHTGERSPVEWILLRRGMVVVFTHEEVENVKTFLRIAVVLTTFSLVFISIVLFLNSSSKFISQFNNGYEGLQGKAKNVVWVFGKFSPFFLIVPLFELVILLPLFPKLEYFIINPLRVLGLANALFILSIVSFFFIDLIGRLVSNVYDMPCFCMWESVEKTIQVNAFPNCFHPFHLEVII